MHNRVLILLANAAIAFANFPASAAPVQAPASAPASARLTIAFEQIETPKGNIMVALYAADSWNGGKPIQGGVAAVGGTTAEATFAALPPGRYALKAFHDLDGDGKIGVNPFGIPTEPFAFSNDAKGERGPPSFEAAAFTIVAGDNRQVIKIH